MSDAPSPIPAAQAAARLRAVRMALLALHKTLIDVEQRRYEQSRGPVASPHALLTLLMQDPFFAWLQPLSQLIVELDEWIFGDEPLEPDQASMLVEQARALLAGEVGGDHFREEYQRALQRSPEVVVAHGRVQEATTTVRRQS